MIIFCKVFALALILISAVTDLRSYKIPNKILLCFLSAAVVLRLIFWDPEEAAEGLTGLVLPFLLLWIFFRMRKMGAGDIKLFCVLGAFMGPFHILWCMFCTFVCGGAAGLMNKVMVSKALPEESSATEYEKLNVAVMAVPAVIMWVGGIYG